jgi:hypothetical protein
LQKYQQIRFKNFYDFEERGTLRMKQELGETVRNLYRTFRKFEELGMRIF